MIKTFNYNNFGNLSSPLYKDTFTDVINQFVENGGNLNYPIINGDSITPALEFIARKMDIEFVKELINKNYLISPGNWILNNESKTIEEPSVYFNYWYRNNYSEYKEEINKGFKDLCKEYNQNPVYIHYKEYYKDEHDELTERISSNNPPLIEIIIKNPYPEMLKSFLEEVSNSKNLLNLNYIFTSEKFNKIEPLFLTLLKTTKFQNEFLALLIKHDIVDSNTLSEKFNFLNLIDFVVNNDDIDLLKKINNNAKNENFVRTLSNESPIKNNFFNKVKSVEMGEYLIDLGCHISVKNSQNENEFFFTTTFLSNSNTSTIKYFLSNIDKKEKNEIFWRPFETVFQSIDNLEDFKNWGNFLVSEGFPIKNYDVFSFCPGKSDQSISLSERLKTCLEIGADSNNTLKLINNIISARDATYFRDIQKTKIIDLYSPNSIYYFYQNNGHTEKTFQLMEKVEKDNFNKLTDFDKPAWFSISHLITLNKIKKNIESFNQVDAEGNNWVTNYFNDYYKIKKTYDILPVIAEMSAIENIKNKTLLLLTQNEKEGNLLHHGFKFKHYNNKELDNKFITIINLFDTTNLNLLLSDVDQNGKFPIEYLIESKKEIGVFNIELWDDKLNTILKIANYNLDYNKKNKNNETLIDKIREYYLISNVEDNFIDKVEEAYKKYVLYHNLQEKLVSNNVKSNKPKI